MIDGKYEYFAFISYKEEDAEWAKWLQRKLEHYKLPTALRKENPKLPERISPIYEYKSEAGGGRLKEVIWKGLTSSKYLIVICSPRATKSQWLNRGIQYFVDSGQEENIIPFIIEGTPKASISGYGSNPDEECFPSALLELKDERELRGININEMGRDAAAVKVVSYMFDLKFDNLWQRYEREKAEEERQIREQRDKLLIARSRFLSEKAKTLIEDGDSYTARLLALEILPRDLTNPDRPFVTEAESVFRQACQHNTAILKGHTYVVSSVVFSPDDKKILSSGWDLSTYVWDAATGAGIKISEKTGTHASGVSCYSPDGNYILTVGFDVKVFNAHSLQQIKILDVDSSLKESAAYSPDGRSIFVSTNEGISIFDSTTYNLLSTIEVSNKSLSRHSFSSDGSKLCCLKTNGEDKASIIDLKSGRILISIPEESITSMIFSPDDKYVATASWNHTIKLWNVGTGELLREIVVSKNVVSDIAFSPDGNMIASSSWDGIVRLWDVYTGDLIEEYIGHTGRAMSVCFSSDGNRLVSSSWDNTIRIWDVCENAPSVTKITPSYDNKVYYSADGQKEIVVAWGNPVKVIDCATKDVILQLPDDSWQVHTADFSPDSKLFVTASQDHSVRIWDASVLKELKRFDLGAIVYSAAFSPDGIHVAAGTDIPKRQISILNIQTAKVETITDAPMSVYSVSYSIDGKYLACLIRGGMLIIYDTQNWISILEFEVPATVHDKSKVVIEPSCVSVFSDDKKISWDFLPLQDVISQNCKRFKNRELTPEERKKYYLE